MYRPILTLPISHPPRRRETWARLLAPLTIWICVSVSLRYGYYGDCRMVLGPNSSRLIKASSVFVEHIEVREDASNGVLLYGFSEKPELNGETNWSISDYMIVGSYNRQGFHLWLNKGSRIRMRWETQTSRLNQLQVSMIKGERKYETILPEITTNDFVQKNEPIDGKDAEYTIEEDDKYYVSVINQNPWGVIMTMTVNVTSKVYDLTKAKSTCSTINESCHLKLFPNIQYVILTTPNDGDLHGWYVEISFVARVITYIAILGFIIIVIFLILKYLGTCDDGESRTTVVHTAVAVPEVSEADPILPQKPIRLTYGTRGEEEENDDAEADASSSSSEELYDAKLCVICYDDQRNCFFVPCGHCATCYDCAQRIMEGEGKVCPICRRLIHKVRRLFNP